MISASPNYLYSLTMRKSFRSSHVDGKLWFWFSRFRIDAMRQLQVNKIPRKKDVICISSYYWGTIIEVIETGWKRNYWRWMESEVKKMVGGRGYWIVRRRLVKKFDCWKLCASCFLILDLHVREMLTLLDNFAIIVRVCAIFWEFQVIID
jgi:hypothetical protein